MEPAPGLKLTLGPQAAPLSQAAVSLAGSKPRCPVQPSIHTELGQAGCGQSPSLKVSRGQRPQGAVAPAWYGGPARYHATEVPAWE